MSSSRLAVNVFIHKIFLLEQKIKKQIFSILNTGRTVEQWHTRTKTRSIEILDNLAPEAWVDINQSDAQKLKVKSGDRMSLSSPRGRVDDVVVRVTGSVRPGTVFVPFHFNELEGVAYKERQKSKQRVSD